MTKNLAQRLAREEGMSDELKGKRDRQAIIGSSLYKEGGAFTLSEMIQATCLASSRISQALREMASDGLVSPISFRSNKGETFYSICNASRHAIMRQHWRRGIFENERAKSTNENPKVSSGEGSVDL